MAPGQALISNFLDSAVAKGRVPINRNDFLKLLDRNGVPTRENMLDKEIMTKGRWVEGTMQNMKGTVKTAVCNPFKT